MFLDVRTLPEGGVVEADICIVGAGPAGIVLASELSGGGLDVVVVESGGRVAEPADQDLCAGPSVGDLNADLGRSRMRAFGGAGRLWGGNCAPFDDIDFERRPWVPDSGWPIPRAEMDRFYDRAAAYFKLGGLGYRPEGPPPGGARLAVDPDRLVEKVFRHSPVMFDVDYADRMARGVVRVLTHATAVELELDESLATVSRLWLASPGGARRAVAARRFVLAAGLDNARLLLLSNRQKPAGIGNDHDAVGRYLMEHVNVKGGRILAAGSRRIARTYDVEHNGGKPFTLALQPSAAVQRAEGILNFSGFLRAWYRDEGTDGFAALQRIINVTRGRGGRDQLAQAGRQLVANLPDAARGLASKLTARITDPVLVFHAVFEQAPNRDSRITLSEGRDALGCPRIRFDCRMGELEKRTYWRASRLIADQLRANGITRVVEPMGSPDEPWPAIFHGTGHFMGTTRMHPDPRHGVVDTDCRVHGTSNLHVAGGSVFPTGGATMVTVNIATLAVRLADRIREEMRSAAVIRAA